MLVGLHRTRAFRWGRRLAKGPHRQEQGGRRRLSLTTPTSPPLPTANRRSLRQGQVAPVSDADLMGTIEFAPYFGINRQGALVITKHADFPQPLAVLRIGKVWRGDDIRRSARNRIRDRAQVRVSATPPRTAPRRLGSRGDVRAWAARAGPAPP
jgi:hypothetical protein